MCRLATRPDGPDAASPFCMGVPADLDDNQESLQSFYIVALVPSTGNADSVVRAAVAPALPVAVLNAASSCCPLVTKMWHGGLGPGLDLAAPVLAGDCHVREFSAALLFPTHLHCSKQSFHVRLLSLKVQHGNL